MIVVQEPPSTSSPTRAVESAASAKVVVVERVGQEMLRSSFTVHPRVRAGERSESLRLRESHRSLSRVRSRREGGRRGGDLYQTEGILSRHHLHSYPGALSGPERDRSAWSQRAT
eukprot:748470-Hanusia_phi.AAC.4